MSSLQGGGIPHECSNPEIPPLHGANFVKDFPFKLKNPQSRKIPPMKNIRIKTLCTPLHGLIFFSTKITHTNQNNRVPCLQCSVGTPASRTTVYGPKKGLFWEFFSFFYSYEKKFKPRINNLVLRP